MNTYFQIGNSNTSNNTNRNMNNTTSNNINNIETDANNTNSSNPNPAIVSNVNANTNAWENDALENDDFDSDQLDEDESYSWASGITDNQDVIGNGNNNTVNGVGSSSSTANWRDWRSSDFVTTASINIFNTNNTNRTNFQISGLNTVPRNSAQSNSLAYKQHSLINSQSNKLFIPKLVDLCAKYVASNLPFELVESFPQPVPEDLQLKITHTSFPDNIENIRLYSCLANGHVDEYIRGEQFYNNGCVRKIIQIGFHLSAQVLLSPSTSTSSENQNANINIHTNNLTNNNTSTFRNHRFNEHQNNHNAGLFGMNTNSNNNNINNGTSSFYASVAIVCDRKRIISCSCTCSKQPVSWCAHIVAVCLYRILDAQKVEYRTPVSESLSKLQRDQLQKFAQYLISELPQQILPTAQKLLDELLKSNETSINLLSGAPDPTAGASLNDISIWCLDENILQENIHKTLLKFIAPAPNVVSDVECLEHQSVTATEYTSLLRPLRGREPEGMWNLISIIREMFRRRDKNSISLLRIITSECLSIDQIIQLWFLVKASQLNHDKALFNSVTFNLSNPRGNNTNNNTNNGNNGCLTQPVHQACASLMDEIVSLWRIACLDPNLKDLDEKISFREQLFQWHQNVFDRLRKFFTNILNNNNNSNNNIWSSAPSNANNSNNYEKLLKRLDMDLFLGFFPAISATEMTWFDFDFDSPLIFRQQAIRMLHNLQNLNTSVLINNQMQSNESSNQELISTVTNLEKIKETNSTPTIVKMAQDTTNKSNKTDLLKNLYLFDYDPSKLKSNEFNQSNTSKDEDLINKKFKLNSCNSLNKEDNRLDILFSRCEALYSHGFTEQACVLAEILADYLLNNAGASLFNNNNDNTNQNETNSGVNLNTTLTTSSVATNACSSKQATDSTNISSNNKSNNLRHKCVNNFHSTILWRSYLLCYILSEPSDQLSNKYNDLINTDLSIHSISVNNSSSYLQTSKLNKLAFRIGLFGLETPRLPAISKSLEVKLINQEQELVNLLKRLQIGTYELNLLRDRAIKLRDIGPNYMQAQRNSGFNMNYYSLPIMLGSFIFEVLFNYSSFVNINQNYDTSVNNVMNEDQQLAFESSLAVLGMKANISESQHPLLCEGIRRHKGDLALTLLLTYKDDEQRLLKIIDKILDRDVHALFRQTSTLMFNPFNPNFKRIQQQQIQDFHQLGLDQQKYSSPTGTQQTTTPILSHQSEDTIQPHTPQSSALDKPMGHTKQLNQNLTRFSSNKPNSAIDSLSSGWEESENESPNLSGDVSLLETKYKCMSLRQNQTQTQPQQHQLAQEQQQNQVQTSKEATSSDNSPTTNRKPINVKANNNKSINQSNLQAGTSASSNPRKTSNVDDSGDDSGESSSGPENSTKLNNNNAQSNKIDPSETENSKLHELGANISDSLSNSIDLSNSKLPVNFSLSTIGQIKSTNNNNNNAKLNYNNLVNQINNSSGKQYNQPSDALLHFMVEFSKTVLCKAGGSVSTSLFSNNQIHQGGGIHRNLHICSFLIGLYALGLHNWLNSNWVSRTYSNIGTFVTNQAAEIGFPAICILIESWQSHFTPSECALLADRVSRGRDNMAVKAAAELALSTLRYANVMNLNEIQRALIQCKEQSTDMLQRGCVLVEHAVKDANSSNLLEILFTVAKRWDELFLESNKQQQNPNSLIIQQNLPSNFADAANNFFNSQPISQLNFQYDSFNSNQTRPNFIPSNFQNHMMPSQIPVQPPLIGLTSQSSAPNLQSMTNPTTSAGQNPSNSNFNNIPINLLHNTNSQSTPFLPMYIQTQQQQSQPQNQTQVQPLTQLIQQNMFQAPNIGQFMPPPPNATQTVAVAAAVLASYMNNTNQKHQANNQTNFTNPNNMNLTQLNQMFNYQQFQQSFLMQQQQPQQPPSQNIPINLNESIDSVAMKHLSSAFRVGIMGLEALPKRLDGSHQIKYRQSPSYADDVKWLWEVAIKLDFYLKSNQSLQQFCQTAANVIQNPFLIQELVMDSANYLCRNNPNPNQIAMTLNLPFLNVLVTRCLHLYHRCCMSKLHHLTPNEHEDFINMLITARNIFYYSNNMSFFSDLIQSLRRSNKCKKEIWNKICNALNNQPII